MMMMLSAILYVVALTSLATASPLHARTVRVRSTRNNLYHGKLDYNVLKADILKTKAKYSKQYTHKNATKRSVGTEILTDYVSGGIDVEYYGPISVGNPSQTIRAYQRPAEDM